MRVLVIISSILFLCGQAFCQERHWSHPDHLVLQYGGSIGYFSGGAGYDVFKNRARASVHYGYVPEGLGGNLNIFSGKLIFIPRSWQLSEKVKINPFDVGLMVSYHAGSDFRSTWPEHRYPPNYYWWQTSFRFHLNVESSITTKIRDHTVFKSVTGYIEFNSNELYMVTYFQNRHALSPADIIKLGAGARFHF
jgi:hypothetical protein